ncbi:MAG TPA: dihydrodipicolinate synthase family protein [Pyrinomonadaceae bacterium]|jgi:dihydrodipicolinate synthase/N-acetylneuraminate lyase|nr:dihydrodipicolinate synthase family protein [Pyrinomonadaceae bacterium]
MNKSLLSPDQLRGVFAVPPLARRNDAHRSLDFEQNELIVKHISAGGINRLIYGGNAFLYHVTIAEFEALLEWLGGISGDLWLIPSLGPLFGRALEQAALLRKYTFPVAMVLPCGDPRDAEGLERGYREIADAAATKLIIYLKDESNFGLDKNRGLDVVGRLVADGICAGIKYAVVRDDPAQDPYLEALLARVDRAHIISGIGERPAVVHLRDWQLAGFTTGSGCIAPRLSQSLLECLLAGDFDAAAAIREKFIPLEDLRDEWGPARVLHHATQLAGIAHTGPISPYVSELSEEQVKLLLPVARDLMSDKL